MANSSTQRYNFLPKSNPQMANGNDLPIELWALIGERLNTYVDYIRFRAVCSSWRNILPKWPIQFDSIPSLMLPSFHPNHPNFQSFYNPFNHEFFYLNLPYFNPQSCSGSSNNGWLIIVNNDHTLKLLNPLTNSQIHLPPISFFYNNVNFPIYQQMLRNFTMGQVIFHIPCSGKIVLSPSSPYSDDFIAVAIHGEFSRLSFTTIGKSSWIEIPTSNFSYFHDCVIFNGKIYVVNSRAELWVSNIETPREMVNLNLKRLRLKKQSKLYLVKLDYDDELLLVERQLNVDYGVNYWDFYHRDYKTVGFNLFKLDSSEERLRWIKINNLDDYCIFLGLNTSFSYRRLLKGNHIYYSDDQTKQDVYDFTGGQDFGVFDVASNRCQTLLNGQCVIGNLFWPPPIWVTLKE